MPTSIRKASRFSRLKKNATQQTARPGVEATGELRALMEAAVDAIVVIDEEGCILSFNKAAERVFGYDAVDVVGGNVEVLMPEPYRSRHADYMRHYRRTGEHRVIGAAREVEGRRSDGTVFPIWLSVGEARSAAGRRFVGIMRDLTPQREAEKELHALEARLAHVGRFSLMGEMAAGIAHEINQPLSAIANYSQAAKYLLERGDVEPAQLRTACTGIAEQVQRAAQVVENIRNFIRKHEVTRGPLDLNSVIKGALSLVAVDARDAGVIVETDFAQGLAPIVGNGVQLQQVLLNLTRNAVDAIRDQRGHRPRKISVMTAQPSGDRVEFEVRDTGPGIPPNLGDAIFHPFVSTKVDGLGVGLAISRTIVEAHGGRLTYRDNPGGGAIFTVSLPVSEET